MTALPTSISDIESLIQNKVPESLHLDYKASPALSSEKRVDISKDVSAFANSDGGLLIYGVEEDKVNHLPLKIDNGADSKNNREWLEQIITSSISPRIDGIEIKEFTLESGRLVICVQVPKSFRGPHQASDNRYYKRFNFSSVPMEHYEVEDTRMRRQVSQQLVSLDLAAPGGGLFEFALRNIGNAAAKDLVFKFPDDMKWFDKNPPEQFVRGIKLLSPGKALHIAYGGVFDVLKDAGAGEDPKFDIGVSYTHGDSGEKLSDIFHFEPADIRGTLIKESDTTKQGEKICQHIQHLTSALEKLSVHVESISTLASATGLELSFRTLKNLQNVQAGKIEIEKLNAKYSNRRVFQEVLGIDYSLAWALEHHFIDGTNKKIEQVNGITQEVIELFHKHFLE